MEGRWHGKKKFSVITSKSYDERYLRDTLLHSYIRADKTISRHLAISGLAVTASNTLNYLVSDAVFTMLATNTTQQLVMRDRNPTSTIELRRFLGHKLLRRCFNMSTEMTWTEIMGSIAQKNSFSLMPRDRFTNILTSIRVYDILSMRSGHVGSATVNGR